MNERGFEKSPQSRSAEFLGNETLRYNCIGLRLNVRLLIQKYEHLSFIGLLFLSQPFMAQDQGHRQPGSQVIEQLALSPQELFKRVAPSMFVIEALDANGSLLAFGSAVVVASGQVVTNKHVVEDGVSFNVKRGDKVWPTTLTHLDPDHDLAELKVDGLTAPAVPVRSSATLAVGERVYAIGAPEGLELTLSEGLISGLREFHEGRVIQTSAAISHGSSGGGLFDQQGRLVGVTTAFLNEGQGLNFALPAEWILGLDKYGNLADGELTGTYSGIAHNLTAGMAADLKIVASERNGAINGCMAVKLPLYGSGSLRGTAHGSQFSFHVRSALFLLDFNGQRHASHISGTYLARQIPGPVQEGTFRLHRDSLEGLPSGFNTQNCASDANVHAQ